MFYNYLKDSKKCDLAEGDADWNLEKDGPDWLLDESTFGQAVKVTHPYYEDAKLGDYGPSPYAKTSEDQNENIKKFEATLIKEKEELIAKKSNAESEGKTYTNLIEKNNGKVVELTKKYEDTYGQWRLRKIVEEEEFDAEMNNIPLFS